MRVAKIEARDLGEAQFKALREILYHGYEYEIDWGSFKGHKRRELDFFFCEIKHPINRPLIMTVPDGVPAQCSIEYVENDYMRYLVSSNKAAGEEYTYGESIERQLFTIVEKLKTRGFNSNQTYCTVGTLESVNMDDPECLRGIDIRVRYGAVHFYVYFRSWDAWAGFPANLAAIQLLKEWVATELNVLDGKLIVASKGLHLYDYQYEIAKAAVGLL